MAANYLTKKKTRIPGLNERENGLVQQAQNRNDLKVLVFKTDISSMMKVNLMASVFDNHPIIRDWFVDIEDVDNVLRIETNGTLPERDIKKLVNSWGFSCEDLSD